MCFSSYFKKTYLLCHCAFLYNCRSLFIGCVIIFKTKCNPWIRLVERSRSRLSLPGVAGSYFRISKYQCNVSFLVPTVYLLLTNVLYWIILELWKIMHLKKKKSVATYLSWGVCLCICSSLHSYHAITETLWCY